MITYKRLIEKDCKGGISDEFHGGSFSIYEFSEPLTKGKICGEIVDLDKPTRFVQISDAQTHVERLVFPMYIVEGFTDDDLRGGTKACCTRGLQCEGVWTMMIHGGDFNTIEPVDNYLNRLVSYNS